MADWGDTRAQDAFAQSLNDKLAGQAQAFLSDNLEKIRASHDAAQGDINMQSVALGKKEDALAGFNIGATSPAYSTSQAGVFIRDSLGLSVTGDSGAAAAPAHTPMTELGGMALLILGYLYLKKGGLHG